MGPAEVTAGRSPGRASPHGERHHQLLAELLHTRLQASAPRLVPELHRRAASWYQDHGFPVEATRHALAGGQWTPAAELLTGVAALLSLV